jgi:putative flavoprotein involved in K+ transport
MDARLTIVGAGPAALALARELQRRGVRPVLLERGRVGETWARQYAGLRLHARAEASGLPGLPWRGTATPFPTADEMVAYLRAYAAHFALDVRERVTVTDAEPAADGWVLRTDAGPWRSERLVMATGIWSAPVTPPLPGRDAFGGRVLHASAYRGADEFSGAHELSGARVLVVGIGNSGKDIALDAARVGASCTVAERRGVVFVPYPSRVTQHAGALWRRLPPALADALLRRLRREPKGRLRWPARPLTEAYPVVGMELLDAVDEGRVAVRPEVVALTERGARFRDGSEGEFDVIVFATGYRPALDTVARHVRLDAAGRPLTTDGVTAAGVSGLYLVGYRYPTLETWLQHLRREAPAAAAAIVAGMRPSSTASVHGEGIAATPRTCGAPVPDGWPQRGTISTGLPPRS